MDNTKLKDKFLKYTKKAIRIGSEAADLTMRFQANRSPLGLLALSSRVIDLYHQSFSPNPGNYFSEWKYIDFGLLKNCIIDFINKNKKFESTQQTFVGHAGTVHEVKLAENLVIGWTENSEIIGPWIPKDQNEEMTLDRIGVMLQSYFSKSILLSSMTPEYGSPLKITNSELGDYLPSQTGEDIYHETIKPFTDVGLNRAILFYGPPGTGKSYIMRHIGNMTGQNTLRISSEELWRLKDVKRVIRLLNPGVILIDDLDRSGAVGCLLDRIDELRTIASLLLVSANDLNKFDAAMLRPSRFDKLVEIKTLDNATLDKLIGDTTDEIRKKLKELPVAYIHEYTRLRKVLGEETALREIDEMQKRAEFIKQRFEKPNEKPTETVPAPALVADGKSVIVKDDKVIEDVKSMIDKVVEDINKEIKL